MYICVCVMLIFTVIILLTFKIYLLVHSVQVRKILLEVSKISGVFNSFCFQYLFTFQKYRYKL